MDRRFPQATACDKKLPVPFGLSQASLSLRIMFVLTFPLYTLTASTLELVAILVLTWTISSLILALLGRKVDDMAHPRLCGSMMMTYVDALLATFTFHNSWLRMLMTYVMSWYAMSLYFPVEYKDYWADFEKPKYQRQVTSNNNIRLVASLVASCALWSGAINENGSTLWLVFKFALIYTTVAEAVGYVMLGWLRRPRREERKETGLKASPKAVVEPVKNKVVNVEEIVAVPDIKNLVIPNKQKRPTTRRRG